MVIGLDFDGTCCTHEYPRIGKDIGAIPWLIKINEAGGMLVLNTMRSGKELNEAVEWLKEQGVELYGVNENPTQKTWTSSPKVYAHLYIDDSAFGCPLVLSVTKGRSYVDWSVVGPGVISILETTYSILLGS